MSHTDAGPHPATRAGPKTPAADKQPYRRFQCKAPQTAPQSTI